LVGEEFGQPFWNGMGIALAFKDPSYWLAFSIHHDSEFALTRNVLALHTEFEEIPTKSIAPHF
jgi:hypothetical protein